MLTRYDLSSLSQAAMSLQASLKSQGWEVNTDDIQGLGQSAKFLGMMWLGKTKVILEIVIDKIQASPVPKTVRECRLLLIYWVIGDLLFSM